MLHVLFLNNRNCYQKICIINNGTFSLFAQFLVRFKDLIDWKLCWISLVQIVWLLSGWLDFEVSYSLTYVLDLLITFTPVYVLHAGSLVDSLLNFNECMKQNDYKIIWTMRFFYMKWQLFFYIAYMIAQNDWFPLSTLPKYIYSPNFYFPPCKKSPAKKNGQMTGSDGCQTKTI